MKSIFWIPAFAGMTLISIMNLGCSWAAAPTNNAKPNVQSEFLYCPEPKELSRINLWWKVGDIWKSYSESFAEHIQTFTSAQWIGVKVGKIICIYKGREALTFPVALETAHPVLVPEPTGENWTTIKEGYKQCFSNDVKDCPFTQQKRTDTSNIYEEIKYQH
jgi:hypothetical protein